MAVEVAIERLVALCFLATGLSHILQPRVWVALFIHWREKGEVGVFYAALLHFNFGALIVAFHSLWRGLPLLVTLIGWALTIKGLLYFCFPKLGLRMLQRVSMERAHEFVIAGVIAVLLALLIFFSLATRGAI